MTDANSRQVALQNLREFQEMSYFDVYALIRQKRFEEARIKYAAVLESMGVDDFSAALNITISTPHDTLLEAMSSMASTVAEPDKIRAVGFDLSSHVIYNDAEGQLNQGIEVSLYSEDIYDFINASDEQLQVQCESTASEWQGNFMEIDSVGLDGLGSIVQQFHNHQTNYSNPSGIIELESGNAIVDPIAIARHVAKLLVAIEYHRYMADFVAEVEVPSQMVFIIGEHDEIEVPIVFYRVGEPEVAPVVEPEVVIEQAPVESVSEELPHEDAPAMYHPSEPAEAELSEVVEVEPVVEENMPEADLPAEDEMPEEVPTGAKAMLGIPLAPKTFGQRSNEIFKDENDEEEGAEKTA